MASSSEGKTVSESFKQCGSCKASSSTKYCADCKIPLCSMCSNIHKNIPATQDHTVSSIQDSMQACKPKTTQGKCSTHNGQALTHLCTNCVQLLCSSCKIDHAGHDLQPLSDDPKVYNKICGKHIQQLIEDLHEVEELKSTLEGHITTYDEAIIVVDKWELDLIKMIRDKANKLRQRIKQLKDEKFKILGDKVKGLMGKLQEIDKSITKLNDIRKSMDTGILANELSKSQELIRKLESYKSELGSLQPAPDVDKVLPNGDKINNVDCDLNLIFSMDDVHGAMVSVTMGAISQQGTRAHVVRPWVTGHPSKSPQPVAEWVFTPANGGRDLSKFGENNVTLTNIKYGPRPDGRPDTAVVLPTSMDQSMIVMNPTDRLRFKNAMTFYCHIYIGDNVKRYGYLFNYDTAEVCPGQHGPRVFVNPDGRLIVYGVSTTQFSLQGVLIPNTWHKIAVVMETSRIDVYINGKHEKTKHEFIDLSKFSVGHIHIGRNYSSIGLQGRIACAQFFDIALTESEIQNLD